MPPDAALAVTPVPAPRPGRTRPLCVADVALFYGERSGGIRTYLEAKAAFARRTGRFEHHLVIPGRTDSHAMFSARRSRLEPDAEADAGRRHPQPSLRLAASNGYRIPLGTTGMPATLRAIAPDIVLLHDPYWTPRLASRAAHELGATVIAVHHSSVALHAAGLPGPQEVYRRALRRWYRRAYADVDAVMSVVDPGGDACRDAALPLRLGLDPEFHPRPDMPRGDHVLYVGRLAREKGVRELLHAAAAAPDPWPLRLIGTGPARGALQELALSLGLRSRVAFEPYVSDREALAAEYAAARCVVLPGAHETFGLAALEAAASGAAVITAATTPAAALIRPCVTTFDAGDAGDLARAITHARTTTPDPAVGAALGDLYGWEAALSAELDDLERLHGQA